MNESNQGQTGRIKGSKILHKHKIELQLKGKRIKVQLFLLPSGGVRGKTLATEFLERYQDSPQVFESHNKGKPLLPFPPNIHVIINLSMILICILDSETGTNTEQGNSQNVTRKLAFCFYLLMSSQSYPYSHNLRVYILSIFVYMCIM